MINNYVFSGNEILINAHGNVNNNRIKNDLIWDINSYLISQFKLYEFFICKKPYDAVCSVQASKYPKRYIAFKELDNMFIQRTILNNDDLNYYRAILDPHRKMNDDVFKEACCMECVDIEYVAIESIDYLLSNKIIGHSIKSLRRWIISSVPIYISLFSAKEVRIIINQSNLIETIQGIVIKYCCP